MYAFMNDATYTCNLRANLMAQDFEDPVNTIADVIKFNTPLYLPRRTLYDVLFALSTSAEIREVYRRTDTYNHRMEWYQGGTTKEFDK